MFETEVQAAIEDLGLQGVRITTEFVHRRNLCREGGDVVGECVTVPGGWLLRVATDLPYPSVVDTIFHEMRHVWQWESGTVKNGAAWMWKGTDYSPAKTWRRKIAYEKRPHEIDARAYAEDAWKRLYAGKAHPEKVTPATYLQDLILER